MSNWELQRELNEYKNDIKKNEELIKLKHENVVKMLLNEMGDDINNVLNGNIKVKLSLYEKIKYKLKYYINKLFNIL